MLILSTTVLPLTSFSNPPNWSNSFCDVSTHACPYSLQLATATGAVGRAARIRAGGPKARPAAAPRPEINSRRFQSFFMEFPPLLLYRQLHCGIGRHRSYAKPPAPA